MTANLRISQLTRNPGLPPFLPPIIIIIRTTIPTTNRILWKIKQKRRERKYLHYILGKAVALQYLVRSHSYLLNKQIQLLPNSIGTITLNTKTICKSQSPQIEKSFSY